MRDHAPDHDHIERPPAQPLLLALALTLSFAGVELVAGWWSGSLALLGDAAHMASDSVALGLAATAALIARRPADRRHSYGFGRTEVVAGAFNALLMLVIVAGIVTAAIARFDAPPDIRAEAVVGVASIGLAVNLVVAWILSRGRSSLNIRGALLHVFGDLLGSVAALSSGLVIVATGWLLIDPILSLLISGLIAFSALRLLRDTTHVIMEAVPRHLDLAHIERVLESTPGVRDIHDLHVWTVAGETVALSAHVLVEDLGQWPDLLERLQRRLTDEFDIQHATLQAELSPD